MFIDGFNFYFGVLQDSPQWKWLNIQSFCEELRKDEEVAEVNYFTAIIDPRFHKSERRDRQKRYLEALQSLSKVTITLGKYQDRQVTCRARCREVYSVPEEKKTDVNIAIQMIDCALQNRADQITLISGDSDLEPAIKWIRENHPKIKITVYIPALPKEQGNRRNDFYQGIGVTCRFLPLDKIEKHQLPDNVTLSNGKDVSRPACWA